MGAPDQTKGHQPFALVVSSQSNTGSKGEEVAAMLKSINDHIRQEIGPIATLGGLVATNKLPKTRSGKTLRKTVRAIVENAAEGKANDEKTLPIPPTIEDRDCLADNIAKIETYFNSRRSKAKL